MRETSINLTCSTFSLSYITASISEEQTMGSSRPRPPPGSVLGQVSPGELTPEGLTSFTLGHFRGTKWCTPGAQEDYTKVKDSRKDNTR